MLRAVLALALSAMLAGCATDAGQTHSVERDAYGRPIVR